MAATYRAVMLTKAGGPEALQCVELPVEQPGSGQLLVRVRAAGVGSTDLIMLTGKYIYAPKIPFVPGYEIAGVVDAIGAGVNGFKVDQRVAGLTVHGGYGELLVREAEHFLPIPDEVSDVEAAAVTLNYVTAWQMIHRVAKVRPGQTALVTDAAGGVGTAALQLLRLAGVKAYGAASAKKHGTVRKLGAMPIDYRTGPIDRLTRALEPHGVDHVFDAIGGPNIGPCIRAARRDNCWLRFHGRHRETRHTGHVRQPLCRSPAARTTWSFLRHYYAVPQGPGATARGSAENLHTRRQQEDRPAGHPNLPAARRETSYRVIGSGFRGGQDCSHECLIRCSCCASDLAGRVTLDSGR